jgi:hypothetical protein
MFGRQCIRGENMELKEVEWKIRHLESLIYEDEKEKFFEDLKGDSIATIKTKLETLKTTKDNIIAAIEAAAPKE